MFHRSPTFSLTAVAIAALILLAAAAALSLASPGTAHAGHGSSLPEVSITSVTPEVGEEGEACKGYPDAEQAPDGG